MFNFREFLRNGDRFVENAVKYGEDMSKWQNYEKIMSNIEKNLNVPDKFDIWLYGSRSYGLASPTSDLDIFINAFNRKGSNFRDNFFTDREKEDFLDDIHRFLKYSDLWDVEVYVPHNKLSVIKAMFKDRLKQLSCDITVNNGLSVASSDLVKHLFDIQPEARWFFHFIRLWLEGNGVKFKTYTLTMLVIYFLQIKNFMPSTKRVQKSLKKMFINDIEIQFCDQNTIYSYRNRKMHNYKNYLEEFFEFYRDFDFKKNFISVVDGRAIPSYCAPDVPIMNRPMCVSSILKIDENTAKLVSKNKLDRFQRVCQRAADILYNNDY